MDRRGLRTSLTLQFHCARLRAPSLLRPLDRRRELLRGNGIDDGGNKSRHSRALALQLLAELPAPGEQLRRAHAMPPRKRADRLLPGKALGLDRSLDLRRRIPPPLRASEHFEAGYPTSASIITWHRHSTSALHPIRALKLGAVLQPRKVGSRPRLQLKLTLSQ